MIEQPIIFVDGAGAYGGLLSYTFTIALVGSSFMYFLFRWYNGSLDMDEEPKMQMMKEENHE